MGLRVAAIDYTFQIPIETFHDIIDRYQQDLVRPEQTGIISALMLQPDGRQSAYEICQFICF